MRNKILTKRAKDLVFRIHPYLNKTERILDLGAGTCHISRELECLGHTVTPVDVTNQSWIKTIQSAEYNGKNLSFPDHHFDTVILITILHHTKNPEEIVAEAARVAKKVIIIEDLVCNPFHKWITSVWDSLLNLEFFNHPHSNKTDREWRALFAKHTLHLCDVQQKWSFIFMWQVTYYLEAAC